MKSRRVEFRIAWDTWQMFLDRCAQLDSTPSKVLRRLVAEWLEKFDNHKREIR